MTPVEACITLKLVAFIQGRRGAYAPDGVRPGGAGVEFKVTSEEEEEESQEDFPLRGRDRGSEVGSSESVLKSASGTTT